MVPMLLLIAYALYVVLLCIQFEKENPDDVPRKGRLVYELGLFIGVFFYLPVWMVKLLIGGYSKEDEK